MRSGLDSLRRIHADHGREWEDVAREIVEDNASLIAAAQEAASELGDGVTWRDVAGLDAPAGVQVMAPNPGALEPEPEAPSE